MVVRRAGSYDRKGGHMLLSTVVVTEFMTNCFIVADENAKDAIIIDPGGESRKIIREVEQMGVNVTAVVCTHAHVDHIGALKDIKEAFSPAIMLHQAELPVLKTASRMGRLFGVGIDDPPEPDRFLAEGDRVAAGAVSLTVIETPGHSPGGISLLTSDGKFCFVGDALFAGSIGRTDLPGGDYNTLIDSIKTKLIPLGDDVKVFTGHGPATTIGVERRYNPFL